MHRNLMAEKRRPLTMAQSVEKGQVEVELRGRKLKGSFALVRLENRDGDSRENWLLIKMRGR